MAISKRAYGEIRIKLNGESVKNHTVDAEDLGYFLINFQELMDKFSRVIPTKKEYQAREIKSKTRLYIKEIGAGSVDVVLMGSPQISLDQKDRLQETYKDLVSTAYLINKYPSKARKVISERFKEPKKRLEVEQKLKYMYTVDKLQIGLLKERKQFVFLNPNRESQIDDWLKQDLNQSTDTIKGIIERLKGDGDKRYFTVRTDDKKFAKCYYNPEIEDMLKESFKKQPIIVSGIVDHKVKGIVIEKIKVIQPWKELELSSLGNFRFKKPLMFNLDFENDLWFIESKEFDVRGCGKYYEIALKDLEDSLRDTIQIYVKKGGPTKMTQKAKELRERLIALIE